MRTYTRTYIKCVHVPQLGEAAHGPPEEQVNKDIRTYIKCVHAQQLGEAAHGAPEEQDFKADRWMLIRRNNETDIQPWCQIQGALCKYIIMLHVATFNQSGKCTVRSTHRPIPDKIVALVPDQGARCSHHQASMQSQVHRLRTSSHTALGAACTENMEHLQMPLGQMCVRSAWSKTKSSSNVSRSH
eukprot:1145191-Pelagomonas_calceolata.AAC.5